MAVRFVLLATVDCVGEVGLGAWKEGKNLIVLYRLADARHFPRRGKQAARIVGARLGLERGVDCVGEVGLGARR